MLGPGFQTSRPQIAPDGVRNAFSGAVGAVAPGEIISIFGNGLGPIVGVSFEFDPQTGLLPTSGPGVSVTWNGIPAPLYFAGTEQLNVQVSYEVAGMTEVRLVVTVNGQVSEAVSVPVEAAHPGLAGRIWNQDGTVNTAENPVAAGDVIVLFATGQGVTSPPSRTGARPAEVFPEPQAPTILRIGDAPAELIFRGQAPGTAGVMQINARVPQNVTPGAAIPVVLSIGGTESQAGVVLAVR